MKNIPLSLYVHIPWCKKKCFYCDFHAHLIDENSKKYISKYITHLINDLKNDIKLINNRKINTIYIGGGTPSLLSIDNIKFLINNIKYYIKYSKNIEITIEVNPDDIYNININEYKKIGINRISIGVQSFNKKHLSNLGRIHNIKNTINIIKLIKKNKFENFNIDLIYGLPNQNIKESQYDLNKIIKFKVPHISWYQLTIEPNTLFYYIKPKLPNHNIIWNMFKNGHNKLLKSGYKQYEISSYSKNKLCKHNINYWNFGDYLGIGCGSHGKITQNNGNIIRTIKNKNVKRFLSGDYLNKKNKIKKKEIPIEFFINRFRLFIPISRNIFEYYTGIKEKIIRKKIDNAIKLGFITEDKYNWYITNKGKLLSNYLLENF
ncbi:radical SAM family heme chaperone HemW [Candidatus Annandia pinicola]|uniref:radical SAM family heme chaperone HemW n=1 Tax=Candidatus Annandia pinicola TaxID=1345117 RepID=UPI001D034217|nr:radical SAM family heme chaperone HemW [Candidatus Annandia pinicola]